jgi:hypothetical protein
MRFGARLASCKLTLFSRRSATGRTADSKYLCWGEFLFHGENSAPNPRIRMVNFERSGFDVVSVFCQIEYVSSDSDVRNIWRLSGKPTNSGGQKERRK